MTMEMEYAKTVLSSWVISVSSVMRKTSVRNVLQGSYLMKTLQEQRSVLHVSMILDRTVRSAMLSNVQSASDHSTFKRIIHVKKASTNPEPRLSMKPGYLNVKKAIS